MLTHQPLTLYFCQVILDTVVWLFLLSPAITIRSRKKARC